MFAVKPAGAYHLYLSALLTADAIRVMMALVFGIQGDSAFCFPKACREHVSRGASNVAFRTLVVR